MTSLTDVMMMVSEREVENQEAALQQMQGRLETLQAALRNALPATLWAELGVNLNEVGELGRDELWVQAPIKWNNEFTFDVAFRAHDAGRYVSMYAPGYNLGAETLVSTYTRNVTKKDILITFGEILRGFAEKIPAAKKKLHDDILNRFTHYAPTFLVRQHGVKQLRADIELIPLLTADERAYCRKVVAEGWWQIRKERQAQALKEAQQAEQAEQAKVLAADYAMRMQAYQEACRQWAETETARLWKPWTLWAVRYVPAWAGTQDVECPDDLIQEIFVLDSPEYFLRPGLLCRVCKVGEFNGKVTEDFTFVGFLDAYPIAHAFSTIEQALPHHRTYSAGNYFVNVPALETEQPAPAPEKPELPDGVPLVDNDFDF